MAQLTQEEIRDELLSIFEEHEQELNNYTFQIEKIEKEGIMFFEKKVIAIKNKLIEDINIKDDDLQRVYLEEIEKIRKDVLEDVQNKIKELIKL